MRKRRISPCFHFIVSLFGSCNTFSQVNVSVVTKTKSRLFKRAYCTTVARAFLSNTEWRRAERTPAAKLTLYSFSLLFSVRPSVNFHIIPCVKIKIGDSNEDETRLTRAFVYLGNFVLFLIAEITKSSHQSYQVKSSFENPELNFSEYFLSKLFVKLKAV